MPAGVTVDLATAADTWELGRRIAALVRPGDVVVLTGALGAGKTVLAQGIGAGLGVTSGVISPTFVLARVHREGRLPLVHVDAYRLGGFAELDDLDLDSDLQESVTVLEWGEGLAHRLAGEQLHVRLDRSGDDERRTAVLRPVGAGWKGRLQALSR
jgi:tRNA threonylcarbamoyladenosine biosynthesis protein TsaE